MDSRFTGTATAWGGSFGGDSFACDDCGSVLVFRPVRLAEAAGVAAAAAPAGKEVRARAKEPAAKVDAKEEDGFGPGAPVDAAAVWKGGC